MEKLFIFRGGPQKQKHRSITTVRGAAAARWKLVGLRRTKMSQVFATSRCGRRVFFHLPINERSLKVEILKFWIEKSEIVPVGP